MRPATDYHTVMELLDAGLSDQVAAATTGVPRRTVNRWRHQPRPSRRFLVPEATWRPWDGELYCYLLGSYLGDGHVVQSSSGSATLRITLDQRYPELIAEVKEAIESLEPWLKARRRLHSRGAAVILEATSPVILHAFPQRGPGRKHLRRIELAPWQSQLTANWPQALLRGLIHSDGCRTVNRFKIRLPSGRVGEYEYPRYFFSNLSDDIRDIFCHHCELLGIGWTQSNHRNISISDRRSVALLDRFVGPKR
jgi:hypothetical protein